jgi:hypothetical protein
MPIQLEEERKPSTPVVKRTALGQKFNGAVLRVDQRDRLKKDDATGQMVPILKPNGAARQELVVTCMTLPGTTAPAGIGEVEGVPEPEDVVRLILKGKAFGDWIEAKNNLGRGIQVGDIVTQITDRAQVYDAQGNASGPELTDQAAVNAVPRGRSVGIYGPVTLRAPKEGSDWVAKAETAYHSLRQPILVDGSTENDTPGSVVDDDEPPF